MRLNTNVLLSEEYIRDIVESITSEEVEDEEQIKKIIAARVLKFEAEYDMNTLDMLIEKIYGKIRGKIGTLSYLLSDPNINEIMINGVDKIFIEKQGTLKKVYDNFESVNELEEVIRRIAASVHREVSELEPILDARLPDGSRVNAVMSNIAIGGPSLSIRRFSKSHITLQEMIEQEAITEDCAEDLKKLVIAGYNVFISGGTSSGKTTFLNALAEHIPKNERIVVVEDSLELNLGMVENIVRLECRNANAVGRGAVEMSDLIRTSLRMRPDRIIVGEVRGKEVMDMLQALNTGHSGLSTGHANSVLGMLTRLESMYLMVMNAPLDAVRMQIAQAIDIMVHMSRNSEGKRRVTQVYELYSYDDGKYDMAPIYELNDNMDLTWTGHKLRNVMKLNVRGLSSERLQCK